MINRTLFYVSDCFRESTVYGTQVEDFLGEHARQGLDVRFMAFTRRWANRAIDNVFFLPPKMFPLAAWRMYSRFLPTRNLGDVDITMLRGYFGGMYLLANKKRLSRTLSVLDIRGDLISEIALRTDRLSKVNHRFLPTIRRNISRQVGTADLVFTVSSELRNQLIQDYGSNPETTFAFSTTVSSRFRFDPSTTKVMRDELAFQDEEIVFCYSGGLDYWQNVPLILTSFETYVLQGGRGRLLLLTRQRDAADNLVSKHAGNSKHLIKIVSADPGDVQRYLQAADIGLLIRDDTDVNRVASPTKYGEYFNCGLHIIITRTKSDNVVHAEQHEQHVTIIDDKTQLVDAMMRFKNRPPRHGLTVNSVSEIVSRQQAIMKAKLASKSDLTARQGFRL